MESEGKRLIDEIRASLTDFELPYEEGRWENFEQQYGPRLRQALPNGRKTPTVRWKYGTAAAILLAALLQMPAYWKDDSGQEADPERPTTPIRTIADGATTPQPVSPEAEPVSATNVLEAEISPTTASAALPLAQAAPLAARVEEIRSPGITRGEFVQPSLPAIRKESKVLSAWKRLSGIQSDKRTGEPFASSKWKFGLEVNSSLITDKPSLAAGVLAQYAISDKIKVATGLSYSRIAAPHERKPVQVSHDTRLVGGKSMLKALDIPIAVVYEPKDGWYASLGVSAVAVLDEDKIHHMERETLQKTSVTDPETGTSTLVFEMVTSTYDAKSPDTDFEGRHNLRYLNLSLGRKQRIHQQLDLHIEPFVKIPIGGLQHGDANLLASGIKLKVLF